MKNATLAVLSIASVAGLAGLASASPIEFDEYKNHGQYVSEVAKTKPGPGTENHGYYVSEAARNGGLNSLNIQSITQCKVFLNQDLYYCSGRDFSRW